MNRTESLVRIGEFYHNQTLWTKIRLIFKNKKVYRSSLDDRIITYKITGDRLRGGKVVLYRIENKTYNISRKENMIETIDNTIGRLVP